MSELSKELQELSHKLLEHHRMEKEKAVLITRQRQLIKDMCNIIDQLVLKENL